MALPLGRPLGLRSEILLGMGLVTLFAVLSTGYLGLWAAGSTLQSQREGTALAVVAAGAAAAGAVVDAAVPLEAAENLSRLRAVMRGLGETSANIQLSIVAANRRVILARPPRAADDQDAPLLVAVLAGVAPVFQYRGSADGRTELVAYAGIPVGATIGGAVRLVMPAPSPIADVLGRSGWLLVGLALGDALLVLGLGYFVLTRLVVRPLQEVERATTRVTAGDWDQRIAPSGPREVAGLGAAFNQMTASLASQREQLIRTEKLASIGQLAAGVAHEIGNPLAAILGYVDILRADAGGRSALAPAERADALDRVKAETQRIHRTIQDLLEYSRPGREEPQATDALATLRSAEALLAPQARFRNVRVEATPSEAWPPVLVSPPRLVQVFVNLLLNAADAMAGKGVVHVGCSPPEAGRVRITFRDEGRGVSPELRRKIFDPFFTTKPPGQGTGLGLSISSSIADRYGGSLELAEGSPPGATFVLTLPAVS